MWILYAFLSAIFAGIMTVLIKLGLKDVDFYLSLTIRTFIVFIICLIIIVNNHKISDIKNLGFKNYGWLFLTSIATFLTWFFYFLALNKGMATKVIAIDKLSIVVVLILSALILKEKLTIMTIIGSLIIIIGSFIVVFN